MNKGVVLRSIAFGLFMTLWLTEPIASLTGEYYAIDVSLGHVVHAVALCCAFACYLLLRRIGSEFHPGAWIAASFFLMMLNMAANDLILLGVAVLPLAASLFFYACYGMGLGFAMCCYIDYLCSLSRNEKKRSLIVSFAVGAVLMVPYGMLLCADFVVLVCAIGVLGLAATVVLAKGWTVSKVPVEKRAQDPLFDDSLLRIFASMLALGAVAGYRTGSTVHLSAVLGAFFAVAAVLVVLIAAFSLLFRQPAVVSFLVAASKGMIAASVFALALFLGGHIDDEMLFTVVIACFHAELFVYFLLYVAAFSRREAGVLARRLVLIVLGGSLGMLVGNAMGLWADSLLGLGDYLCVAVLLSVLAFSINGKMFVSADWSLGEGEGEGLDAALLAPEFSVDELRTGALAMAAQYSLTQRQTEVFLLLLQGKRPKAIAEMSHRSEATIRSHVSQIHSKMGVSSSEDLVRLAHEFFDKTLA